MRGVQLSLHVIRALQIMSVILSRHLHQRLSLLLGDSRYIGKKPVKNCLNARAKMTSDKFDDERLLARKTNEKMKNG